MISNIKSYIINLQKYKNKYKLALKRLNKLNIKPERFNAIYIKNENDLNIKKITYPSVQHTIKYGRNSHNNIGSAGAIGCYLSHILLWKKLIKSEDEMYMIFEDDVNINKIKNIDKKLNDYLINVYTQDWDFIYLNYSSIPNNIKNNQNINKYYNEVNGIIYGTHAYIINKKGANKLLKQSLPIVDQIDSYISYMILTRNINAYTPKYNFFIQNNILPSTIQIDYSIKPWISGFDNEILIVLIFVFIFNFLYFIYNLYKHV